jgi:Flp pilus assembly protein TadD/peroxiredoxin
MASEKTKNQMASRRDFIKWMSWSPLLFVPAPPFASPFRLSFAGSLDDEQFPFTDVRLKPHYPAKSPLEDTLRLVAPGTDQYITEKYADEIMNLLGIWGEGLKSATPALAELTKLLDPSIEATPLVPVQEICLRSGNGLEIFRRQFTSQAAPGREQFLHQIKTYLSLISRVETAEFEIVGIEEMAGASSDARVDIRYDLVGTRADNQREERIGHWRTRWSRDGSNAWRVFRWEASEETVSRTRGPIFIDVTSQALGETESYKNQMLFGADHWRTVLDGACGIDVYGNNGLAVGDFDNDGLDDFYVCQPAGLPNRLYHNRGDGTFEDVTEQSNVGVLDNTACALFADFENKGLQDLLVVCGSGPLLFLNRGKGKFELKHDAFKFARPPQGTFTHAAVADYDRDGLLDVYFCVYSYYQGLDQYRYPVPYFDARNGPPNFLMQNQGDATFKDRTEAAGLNVDNDRYSFACAWSNSIGNGAPDIYVANDFGRSNLYRNQGDGTFVSISTEASVEDVGAGMSTCWFDYDNDGNQDIYVANMWSAAGIRISQQKRFHEQDPETVRALYRQHARGNSLYRNLGNGKFQNVSREAGVEMGRWSWSSDAWDFDHDGYPDLYIANGYISGPDSRDLSSFFWRQLVARSPANATPSLSYERSWNAINELVRSDSSWSSRERNVFYVNNHDGTFTETSGTVGLDFADDSRAFVLADLDHDGRLEIVLKNRNAPQLRILRNAMKDIGDSIAIRLRGNRSNRDAIGTAVTIEVEGNRQTKYLQAGSGFLSQHTKELFFGVGKTQKAIRASIHWPSGLTQTFEHLPVNHRIDIEEDSEKFSSKPFARSPAVHAEPDMAGSPEALPSAVETWLIEPLSAPDFSLPDLAGKVWDLQSLRSDSLLLHFWTTASPACVDQLRLLRRNYSAITSNGLRIVGVNLDDPRDIQTVQSFVAKEALLFPVLLATQQIAGIYNITYRYLFDRRRELGFPTSFLLNEDNLIVKVYQGTIKPARFFEDSKTIPRTPADRIRRALPFPGTLYQGSLQRNAFTYGVALFQRGYLEPAATSFKQVIAAKPDDPEAYYNLGTLELRRNSLREARQYLERTVKLKPNYPEAWNNLGMIAGQQGQVNEAIRNFEQSLLLRPGYATALLNLGNLYRYQGNFVDAETFLNRALDNQPDDPEVHYSLGMLYARQDQLDRALTSLEKAVELRPDYPDALNNLGVLLVREKRYQEAEEKFKTCIGLGLNFDQAYLNLARLYVIEDNKEKAKDVLHELLRLQPQHKVAQQALEVLH